MIVSHLSYYVYIFLKMSYLIDMETYIDRVPYNYCMKARKSCQEDRLVVK
jgi:hypothetical protein